MKGARLALALGVALWGCRGDRRGGSTATGDAAGSGGDSAGSADSAAPSEICGEGGAGPTAWWPGAGSTRVAVRVASPDGASPGATHALALDLGSLGIDDPALLATARLLRPGCDHASPDLDLQVEDGLSGLLDPRDHGSPLGDGRGDLYFTWPADDPLAPGDERDLWLHLGGDAAPALEAGVAAAPGSLSAGALLATFDAGRGGLLDGLRLGDGPPLLDQASAGAGNGAWVGDWAATPTHSAGALAVLADGPLVGVVQATGTRAGLAWTVTYAVPRAGDALWLKTHLEAVEAVWLDHPGDWANGVRPLQSRHPALEPVTASLPEPPYDGLELAGPGGGLVIAWRSPPARRPYPPEVYGGNLIVFGHDLGASEGGARGIEAGAAVFDHRTMLLLPHDGDPSSARASMPARLAGLTLTLGAVERR